MRRFILGICLLAAIANIDAAAQKRLTILHVNDTHSHLEPERSGERECMGGVLERAAYRDSVVKADGKRNVRSSMPATSIRARPISPCSEATSRSI